MEILKYIAENSGAVAIILAMPLLYVVIIPLVKRGGKWKLPGGAEGEINPDPRFGRRATDGVYFSPVDAQVVIKEITSINKKISYLDSTMQRSMVKILKDGLANIIVLESGEWRDWLNAQNYNDIDIMVKEQRSVALATEFEIGLRLESIALQNNIPMAEHELDKYTASKWSEIMLAIDEIRASFGRTSQMHNAFLKERKRDDMKYFNAWKQAFLKTAIFEREVEDEVKALRNREGILEDYFYRTGRAPRNGCKEPGQVEPVATEPTATSK